jgi:glycosyltransferase involved in cell wall biosynthesis
MPDILVIGARGIPGVEGGAEKHAENVFSRFAAHGYRVTLLGTRDALRLREYRGIKLVRIPTFNIASTEKLVYHFLSFLYALAHRPKLVHLQGLNSGIFLFLYKLFGMRVVIRYGSADYQHAKWGRLGRLAFRFCEWQMRFADHVISVSRRYQHDLLQRHGLRTITVIPNGTDEISPSESAESFWKGLGLTERRYVLAVGRLTVDKGFADLIAAFESLDEPDLQLVIVGGPDNTDHHQELRALAGPRTRFLGRLDRRLLVQLYRNCGVYVSASSHEGLSNSILEAISCRCPLVVSSIPANREMPLNEPCYFARGDVRGLAEKIAAALRQPQDFIVDPKSFIGWDEAFEQTERVYHRVFDDFAARPAFRARAARTKDRKFHAPSIEPQRLAGGSGN